MKYLVLVLGIAASSVFASGFKCTSEEGYNAKVINSTTSPRKPAVFVVSNHGTILSAKNDEISKRNLSNGVRYSASGDDNTSAVLFIQYKEGVDEPLESGETVYGKLILTVEGEKETVDMECARYLKNN